MRTPKKRQRIYSGNQSSAQPQTATRRLGRQVQETVYSAYQSIRDDADDASRSADFQTSDVGDGRISFNPDDHPLQMQTTIAVRRGSKQTDHSVA